MYKFILSIFLGLSLLNIVHANEIKQINDEVKPHYLITVKQDSLIGTIEFEAFPDVAPKHCHNLDSLVGIKFYDGTAFHRVIPGFMIQGGDPNSKNKPKNTWGYGDPSQTTVPDEFNSLHHVRGILSAASTTNPNSATSQFFICVASIPDLDGRYSIYGQVVKGMDIVDKIVNLPRDANNNPLVKAEMTIVKLDPSDVKDILYNSGDIKIYPNPASDFIGFMSEKSDFLITSINITDINGINYFTQQYNTYININDIKIPVSKIPVGVYYINMKGNSGLEYNLRFIRE